MVVAAGSLVNEPLDSPWGLGGGWGSGRRTCAMPGSRVSVPKPMDLPITLWNETNGIHAEASNDLDRLLNGSLTG